MDMSGKKSVTSGTWVDPDDAPELTEAWFAKADLFEGSKLIRKGGRPKSALTKKAVNIRLSPDVLAYFRSMGKGWQTRLNDILKDYVHTHPKA
jgi:uncharacterized protein (DUF4415 family)